MPTDVRSKFSLHALTIAATCASAVALASSIAVQTAQVSLVIAIWSAIGVAMLLAAAWFQRLSICWPHAPAVTPIFLALAVCPCLGEGISRAFWEGGQPLEIVLLTCVQLVACGMAAASVWQIFQPLTMVAGLFVTLFASSISPDSATHVAAGLFAFLGLIWLVSAHWSALAARMPRAHQRRQPRSALFIPLLGTLAVAMAGGAIQSDRFWALAGFMPSSGGDGCQNAAANRGVGDGEALVAGQDDIQSFGPIEDAPFRASEDPSLYDLFNDLYEEPVIVKKQERAIALPPDLKQQLESRMAKSQRATREFSTARKQRSKSPAHMEHLTSDALFYVKGRTPLHLRHELYDLFDGAIWHAVEETDFVAPTPAKIEALQGRPWLVWPDPPRALEFFGPVDLHALKIVHLKSNRIPTPLQLRGVHIDEMNREDFYHPVGDQLIRLDVKSLPELTAIHLRSQTVDRNRFLDNSFWVPAAESNYAALPIGEQIDRIRELAQQWTANRSRGWPQIDAVLHRLRAEYTLDPEARPSDDATCPVSDFLLETRRGPDYQFASAAAVMLRTLGYSTRLAGGFYVSPERYDRLRAHTPVAGSDAHLWLEVHYTSKVWLTLDPTPGYEVLGPPPGWWERTLAQADAIGRWIAARWAALLMLSLMAFVTWWRRVWWLDRLTVARWYAFPASTPRDRILQTAWLIETRLWLANHPRRPGQTWAALFSQLPGRTLELHRLGTSFASLADWAVFAPESEAIPESAVVRWDDSCRRIVEALHPVVRPARGERWGIRGWKFGEAAPC